MIDIKHLYHRYIREYYALFDINLHINKGEKVAFVGAENSGKTSLIRILTKLENPYKGDVYIKGIHLKKINYKTDLSVGYLPTCPIFLDKKTVYDNIKYILKAHNCNKQEIDSKVNELLKKFNLTELASKKIKDLSLFEKYVVSIARLTIRNLDILLIDDIFEKLNNVQLEKIIDLLKQNFYTEDAVVIVATSDKKIAEQLANINFYFKSGSLVDDLCENQSSEGSEI